MSRIMMNWASHFPIAEFESEDSHSSSDPSRAS
jgi:hypothetical protein